MNVISVSGLNKQFVVYKKNPGLKGAIQSFFKREPIANFAVKNFNLTIPKGEIIGLLGPNGAGKTTLMKMFSGIIVPSSGELNVLNYTPHERKWSFLKKIGLVMGQKSQLWWDLPALDSFELLRRYYEVEKKDFNERLEELSSLLDVKQLLQIHIRKLSLGERMKMELLASLLHRPEILFLDEPTIGLDISSQKKIRNFLLEYRLKHQTTIILTSHYMADVESLCSRLVLITKGEKSFDDSTYKFKKLFGNDKVITFYFKEPCKKSDYFNKFSPVWDSDYLKVDIKVSEEEFQQVCIYVLQNFDIVDFETQKTSVELVMDKFFENSK